MKNKVVVSWRGSQFFFFSFPFTASNFKVPNTGRMYWLNDRNYYLIVVQFYFKVSFWSNISVGK